MRIRHGNGRNRWRNLAACLALGVVAAAAQGVGYQPPQGARPVPPVTVPAPPGAAELSAAAAGGVPAGAATGTPLALSLADAVDRGLQNNLAGLLAANLGDQAKAQHYAALSALLPRVDAGAGEIRQKINLAAFGLTSLPGIPALVGPFDVFNANVSGSLQLFNESSRMSLHAADTLQGAAKDQLQAARDLVVLAVLNQYLLTIADQSRVAAAQAELATAESQFTQARDMKQSGTVDAIVVVRAQLQRDHQQQQLLAQQNQLAKQRLALARAIGLPLDQAFTLTGTVSAAPLTAPEPAAAVAEALHQRADYRAAEAVIAVAQWNLKSARAERLPTLSLNGQYGPVGRELINNHPVYSMAGTVTVPVLEGGLFKADILSSQVQVREAEQRAADLRATIENQVRNALFDLDTSRAQLEVAGGAHDLAQQELTLAADRFRAGVADNLEVVQAQQSVAEADENLIAAQYAFSLAKAGLAQALGVAQADWQRYLQP